MPASKNLPWKWMLLGAVLIAVIAGWFLLPLEEWAKSFNVWIKGLGVWGGVIFAGIYIIATVILAPASLLTIVAGLAYGVGVGFPLVVVAATVGATAAFLIARYVARAKVETLLKERPKFAAVDKAISEEGWKVVLLLRLSPLVPFNLQNYFYGVTDIKFWQYVAATLVGIMPGTLLYVYLGAVGQAALGGAQGGGGSALKWGLFAIGLLATIVVTVFVAKKARAKLAGIGVDDDTRQ